MASTNKTPHLGLNQWVLDDPFLMEDMNSDNAKIDAAVKSLDRKSEFIKLKTIVTQEGGVSQIDIDVSDICFGDWQYIIFDFDLFVPCDILANNDRTAIFNSFYGLRYASAQTGRIGSTGAKSRMFFLTHLDAENRVVNLMVNHGDFNLGTASTTLFSDLTSVNFVRTRESDTFDAGRSITIWGVK